MKIITKTLGALALATFTLGSAFAAPAIPPTHFLALRALAWREDAR